MFRGETVVNGDNDGGELTSENAANGVVSIGRRAEKSKAATVKEEQNGKGILCGGSGNEESEPEIARGIDGMVEGRNATAGRGGGGW